MGFFTWTDARCKAPRHRKNGDYYAADTIGYDCWCKVICPDNTEIVESCYDGYGMFNGHDIYELVVDWNKNHLEDIFKTLHSMHGKKFWGAELEPVAIAYQRGDEKGLKDALEDLKKSDRPVYMADEWKREIGIAIACEDDIQGKIPYPIKITRIHKHKPYEEWNVSWSTQ